MSDRPPLVTAMEEIFSSKDDLMVTILIDGSGSVTSSWEEMKLVAENMVGKLEGVEIQIVQFSTTARTECAFTKNTNALKKTLKEMKIIGQGTNTHDALQMVRMSLMRSCTDTSVPVVFLFTDGEYNGKHPQLALKEMLALKPAPKVIGIGIGEGISVDKLGEALPNMPVFHAQSYAKLNSFIESLVLAAKPQEPAIKIEFHNKHANLQRSKEDLKIHFQVEPDLSLPVLPANTSILFLPNSFFYGEEVVLGKEVKRGQPLEISVVLKIKPNAINFGEFPEKLWYETTIPNSPRGKYRGSVQMLLGWFANDFIYITDPERPINILMWGPMGAGKTQCINGLMMLFSSSQDVMLKLTSFRASKHVTRNYTCNAVAEYVDDPPTALGESVKQVIKIRFWDVWGVTTDTYKHLSINHFLEGRVPNKTELNDNPSRGPVIPDNEIDGVIFVIPIGTSEDESLLETLSDNIATVLRNNITPVVVVNFLNTISSQEEIDIAYKKIFNATGLSEREIFKIDNYVDEQFRNMGKDLLYWKILTKVFHESTKHMSKNPRHASPTHTPSPGISTPISPYKPPRSPSFTSSSSSPQKLCQTSGCADFGKQVSTKRCGECGNEPYDPTPPPVMNVCPNLACVHYGKQISAKFCEECGTPGRSLAPPSCKTKNCKMFGQEMSSKFCSECGKNPSQ